MALVTMTAAMPAAATTQCDAPRPGHRTTAIQTRLVLAMIIGVAADLRVMVSWIASSGTKSASAVIKEKAVAVNVDVDGSAPSFAQSTHKQQVVSVQQAKHRAPSAVSSCGAAAKTECARISGQSNASTTDSERRAATIRSQGSCEPAQR